METTFISSATVVQVSTISLVVLLTFIAGVITGRIWSKISFKKSLLTVEKINKIELKNKKSEASETVVSAGVSPEPVVEADATDDVSYPVLVDNLVSEEESTRDIKAQETKFEKVDDLVRKAAGLKNENLADAISMMRQVVGREPEEQEHYFRLSSYLHAAGEKAEAFGVLSLVYAELDFQDVFYFNSKRCLLLEKKASLLYKDKCYPEYLINYGQWLVNRIIALACSGKEAEIKDLLKAKSKFGYLAPAKVEGALKRLDNDEDKTALNKFLTTTLNSLKADVLALLKIAQLVILENEKKEVSRILWEQQEANTLYVKLNDDVFFVKLETELSKLVGKAMVSPEFVNTEENSVVVIPDLVNTDIAIDLDIENVGEASTEFVNINLVNKEVDNRLVENTTVENKELIEQLEGD